MEGTRTVRDRFEWVVAATLLALPFQVAVPVAGLGSPVLSIADPLVLAQLPFALRDLAPRLRARGVRWGLGLLLLVPLMTLLAAAQGRLVDAPGAAEDLLKLAAAASWLVLGAWWVERLGWRRVAGWLVVAGTVAAGLSLLDVLVRSQRAEEPFGHPNKLAAFVVLAGGLAAVRAREAGGPGRWDVAALLLTPAALVASASRGVALAALVAAVGVVAWTRRDWGSPGTRRTLVPVGALVGVGLCFALMLPTGASGLERTTEDLACVGDGADPACSDDSLTVRLTLWSTAWDLVRERPLTGHGAGQFVELVTQRTELWPQRPHQEALELLVSHGLLGATGFVAGTVLLGRAIRSGPSSLPDASSGLAAWMLLSVPLAHGLVATVDHFRFTWLAVALAAAAWPRRGGA